MGKGIVRYIVLILPIIYSCENQEPLSYEDQLEINDNGAKITLEMDENLLLTVGVKNLENELAFLSFSVNYDSEKISNGGVLIPGNYNIGFSSLDYDGLDKDSLSVIFSGVSGTGDLFKLQFSGSSYKGVIIRLLDVSLIDSNSNPSEEQVTVENVCYIDEGVLIQGTENTSQPIDSWNSTGNYLWTNYFCQYY